MPQYNDRSASVIVWASVLSFFSILAIILRLVARSRTKVQYAPDDWWSIVSLITLLIWEGVVIWSMFGFYPQESSKC